MHSGPTEYDDSEPASVLLSVRVILSTSQPLTLILVVLPQALSLRTLWFGALMDGYSYSLLFYAFSS